jgi:uncharacterized protein (TIGR01777 family)
VKVLLLGASGFLGRHFAKALERRGDEVVMLSLRDPAAAAVVAATCDGVVNFAGEPVAQRWNAIVKQRILYSRTELPRRFLAALSELERKTIAYLSASGIGYYGTSETETFVETSPPGDDFLAQVCVEWEAQALKARELGLRVAVLRTGLVLGTDGGALAKLLPAFRFGLGGTIGNGRQWYSWIHIDDLIAIYLSALDGGDGAYDATAPVPVTNAEFTFALGKALHRPVIFPTPTVALRLMLGEGAYSVLTGQRVLPQRTEDELHYRFAFETLDAALADLIGHGTAPKD